MVQVAKNRYASEQYHDFIGFKVSKSLLERVFPIVYGVELKDVLPRADLAIGSYRFSISRLIPEMTQVALQTHKKDLMRETPSFAKQKFLYRLSRSDYEREWGKDYSEARNRHPGLVNALAIHAAAMLIIDRHYRPAHHGNVERCYCPRCSRDDFCFLLWGRVGRLRVRRRWHRQYRHAEC